VSASGAAEVPQVDSRIGWQAFKYVLEVAIRIMTAELRGLAETHDNGGALSGAQREGVPVPSLARRRSSVSDPDRIVYPPMCSQRRRSYLHCLSFRTLRRAAPAWTGLIKTLDSSGTTTEGTSASKLLAERAH
jgi:hypothetical protein